MAQHCAWLEGTFRGEGCGCFPTVTPFEYVEEVSFEQVAGKPIFFYRQKTWKKDNLDVAMHAESGYLRLGPPAGGPGKAQLCVSQITGLTEICEGIVSEDCIAVESTMLGRVTTAKEPAVTAIFRKFHPTPEGGLKYIVEMSTTKHDKIETHLEATLKRISPA
mmetsp:Transcript_46559/g.113381  ORF Transcript_46559/g.113381 Transcript_46559/m.113381 type:complete len:163 (-) Transcript_46559:317-805(-)|eukprot:CAMPEP_0206235938 /NCGR_PEP_ID=MMETSP0047_2-20121206/13435_1 /ASSEMBLY_ACC=CAM_ASM_000192 /TAXON_ID=195065 /ORGANISM="Chroomonas mesostigmatica_cf, Strain CCMP1168" /LENGTH=162 /DNA_ID=CAMNT_0053660213 /DNA_START=134 /DNA_END=622 /DNA_ORIENTATION=-